MYILICVCSVCQSASQFVFISCSPLSGDQPCQVRLKAHKPKKVEIIFKGRMINWCFSRRQNMSRTQRRLQIDE